MPQRHRFFALLIPLLFLAIAFLGGEWYLRAQRDAFRQANKGVEQTFRAAALPGLIYERIPHTEETNNHGFRGEDYAHGKPEDIWRVVLVGDSIAQGHGIPMAATLGKRLEEVLNHKRLADAPLAQVYVVAETGYNTAQELLLLEHAALRYHPDLIVWAYCLNDPAHAVFHNEGNLYSQYFHDPPSLAWDWLRRLFFKARERIRGIGADQKEREYHRFLHTTYKDQVRRHIARIASLCKQADVPVLFLIIPVLETKRLETDPEYVVSSRDYELLDVHTEVARLALQQGLDVVEGLDAYVGRPLADLTLSPDDIWHPSPAGHELLALQLQKHMLLHGPYPGR